MSAPAAAGIASRLRSLTSGRAGVLLGARVLEQAGFGAISLILARWVGPDAYPVIGALLVFNSFSLVASDLGTGLAILSSEVGSVDRAQVRRMRLGGAVVAAALLAAALVADGPWREGAVWAAVLWVVSAEAYTRKSALLRMGRERTVAGLEATGAVVLVVVALAGATIFPDRALTALGVACALKHVIEALGCRRWEAVLGAGRPTATGSIWWSQLLWYATANVDFVLVSVLVSAAAFSVYSVGFRGAALVTSQVSFAMGRIVLVDLAASREKPDDYARVYERSMRLLFAVGLTASVLTVAAAPLLPVFLGSSWRETAWVVAVLSVGTPWRMVFGVTSHVFVTTDRAPALVRCEVVRFLGTVAVLAVAGLGGLWSFTAAVAVVMVVSTLAMDQVARRGTALRRSAALYALAPVGIGLAVAVAALAAR